MKVRLGKNKMDFIKHVFYGVAIGISNVIPGLSGGTTAVILNIYDRLIGSISNLRKEPKKSLIFLLPLVLGAGLAILACSNLITYLLERHYMLINFFFIGIIFGSIPMIWKRATKDSFKPWHLIPCAVTFAIMIVTVVGPFAPETETVITSVTPWVFIQMFFCSALAAVCMIIPGISGSFVMLLFGVYTTVMTAISSFDAFLLLPIALGAGAGILFGAKIIDFFLRRYPQATYFSILGFVLGSGPVLFGKILATNNFRTGLPLAGSIAVLIVGIVIVLVFDSKWLREKLKGRTGKKLTNSENV